MFAVPGWSVSSASLKRQTTEIIDVEHGSGGVDLGIDDESKSKDPRKRKRGNGHLPVTKDNVAELWGKIIERSHDARSKSQGKGPSKREKRKRQKQIEDSQGADHAADKETERKQGEDGDKNSSLIGDAEGKSKKRRRTHESGRREDKVVRIKGSHADHPEPTSTEHPIDISPASGHPDIKLTPLQASMRQKLTSARFRHLNQSLYTTSSADSFKLFQENPEMFEEYHEGFRRQVAVWPENPVDAYIQELQQRAEIREGNRMHKGKGKDRDSSGNANNNQLQPLPRTDGICSIADLGCGDAKLARTMESSAKKMKLRIFSYDLYSPNQFVTKADITNLPLKDGSIDLAVFCLALMGTNWIDFVEEAYRILRWKGELWVAEIKSRFGRVIRDKGRTDPPKSSKGKSKARKVPREEDDEEAVDIMAEVDGPETHRQEAETDVSAFVEVLRRRGFALRSEETAIDGSNKMFVKMYFVKRLVPTKGKGVPASRGETGGHPRGDSGKQKTRTKYVEGGDGEGIEEAAVLKPCVYKLR